MSLIIGGAWLALCTFNGAMRLTNLLEEPEIHEKDLPPVGEAVIVRCPTFQCLAYRGRTNQWWDANDGRELKEVLEVIYRFGR